MAQLGSPDAPTPQAVRPYLRQFLSDRRVIDYPPLIWQPILRGIILNVRPRKSARLYRRIWLDEGSPLVVYSQRQVAGLQARLGNGYRVALGMTYGRPGIANALRELVAAGCERVLVFPMYPQYSATTTASVYDAVARAMLAAPRQQRFVPALRVVPPYYAHPGYLDATASRIAASLREWGQRPDRVVFSFHGIPARYARGGDPYPVHCAETARRLAAALQLTDDQWTLSYQSRFGPEAWLEPATAPLLAALPGQGVSRVAVASPGFVTDCLETLDELGHEGRETFVQGGGQAEGYHVVPCLNDDPAWLDAMAELVRRESAGWQAG